MLRIALVCFSFATLLFGQFDAGGFATGLSGRYGPALDRQTFEPKPGIEMIVDYASNGHVCRIQLPAVAPEKDRPNVTSPRGLEEFLAELVPMNLRGKEVMRFSSQMGLTAVESVQYENVTISVMSPPENQGHVTVTFRGESCRNEAFR
jgi:hypothetical protein